MPSPAPSRPPLWDTPWFWVHLFTTAALIVLMLMRTHVQERQTQIERKFQGRERATERAAGQEPQTPLSTPEDTIITLTPLFVVLGLVWVFSWIMLLRRFRRTRPATLAASAGNQPP